MTWHKADTRLQCSPRLRDIARRSGLDDGRRCTLVFAAVLAVHAEHGDGGDVPAMAAALDVLGSFCPLVEPSALPRCLELLAAAGLIQLQDDGGIHLLGWDDTWRAVQPSTARVRMHRALKQRPEGGST